MVMRKGTHISVADTEHRSQEHWQIGSRRYNIDKSVLALVEDILVGAYRWKSRLKLMAF